jgi:uncharacterized protein (TIGR03437 family)
MNVSRITLIGLVFVPWICSGKGAKETCGTYPERVLEELLQSHLNGERRQVRDLYRKLSGLAAVEEVRGASRDVGNLVVMEEDEGIISRRKTFTLNGRTLRFTPAATGYRLDVVAGNYDAAEQGTAVADLGDDDTREVRLGFELTYFGQRFRSVHVNSDGNLSFGAGDGSTLTRSLGRLLSGLPRIAGLFEDLDPSRAGSVNVLSRADRMVVSWVRVPEYSSFGVGPLNTFQIRLLATGVIEIAYQTMDSEEGVVGIAPGDLQAGTNVVSLIDSSGRSFVGAIAERFALQESLDTVTASQRFFETHEDAYDYLVFYNALGITAGTGVVAFEVTVRNQRTGFGDSIVEAGAQYGSPRRLQAVLNMGPVTQYPVDPNAVVPSRFSSRDTPTTILAHEAGHLFLAFASVRDPNNPSVRPMLGRQSAHWNFTFNSEASLLEGNRIQDKGLGASPRFETVAVTEGYSLLDQYLMGFRPKEDVPPMFYVSGAGINAFFPPPPTLGVRFDGVRRDVDIDQVIAEMGRRTPDHTVAQRKFRFGFVLVVPKGVEPDAATLSQVEGYRRSFEEYYFRAAGQRASADATLKKSVALSLWPASGVVAGQTATASLRLAGTASVARSFALRARSALVEVPTMVSVAAGQASVNFAVRGLRAGVDLLEVTPTDSSFESVEARVQVVSAVSALTLEVVSGAGQVAGADFLAAPVVVRVGDANRLGYPGIRVVADAGTGAVEPASAVADENGLVRFRWRPAAAPFNRLGLRVEGGPSGFVTSLGRPFVLSSTVVNAASFAAGMVPLGIHTIFGANLSGGVVASASSPWPGRINGVEVLVNGRLQPLIFVSDSQINFYLADEFIGASDVSVQVVTPLGESAVVRVPLQRVQPGIFPGAVLRRGEFLEVYATGLGAVRQDGSFQRVVSTVEVLVNGQPAEVLFAGLAPGFVGLYQVNVRGPGAQRVRLRVGGVESNEMLVP